MEEYELLKDMIDMHLHPAPSAHLRRYDFLQMAKIFLVDEVYDSQGPEKEDPGQTVGEKEHGNTDYIVWRHAYLHPLE